MDLAGPEWTSRQNGFANSRSPTWSRATSSAAWRTCSGARRRGESASGRAWRRSSYSCDRRTFRGAGRGRAATVAPRRPPATGLVGRAPRRRHVGRRDERAGPRGRALGPGGPPEEGDSRPPAAPRPSARVGSRRAPRDGPRAGNPRPRGGLSGREEERPAPDETRTRRRRRLRRRSPASVARGPVRGLR